MSPYEGAVSVKDKFGNPFRHPSGGQATTRPRTRLNGIPASSETLQKARHEAAGRTFNHLACSESKWEDLDVCRKVGTALGSRE